jgi:hypothetical protein
MIKLAKKGQSKNKNIAVILRSPLYCLQAQSDDLHTVLKNSRINDAKVRFGHPLGILKMATALQAGLIAYATGKPFEETGYQDLRRNLLAKSELKAIWQRSNTILAQTLNALSPGWKNR